MTDKIHWGILSTADINSLMIPAIRKNTRCEVHSVASRSLTKAREYAAALGIPVSYGSYDQLINDKEIDAIYISLPNSLHHEWCIKAARAGKHVLCEKPLATTVENCLDMIHEADRNDVFLQEGFMYRYHPRTHKIKEVVDQVFAGKMNYLYGVFSYSFQEAYGKIPGTNYRMIPELGGGCLWDVGAYVINFMRYLNGSEPVEVYGTMRNYPGHNVDGIFCGVLRFPNDVLAQFQCSYLQPQKSSMEIVSDKYSLKVPYSYCLVWDKSEPVVLTDSDGEKLLDLIDANAYEMEVNNFCACVLDKKKRDISLEDALNNTRVLVALSESAQKGCVIRLIA